jgi:predicted translin family RNA/ssDNA-binding protein/uncharacterized protein YerC
MSQTYSDDQDRQLKIVTAQMPIYADRILLAMTDKIDGFNHRTLKADISSSITLLEENTSFYQDVCDNEEHIAIGDRIMEIVNQLAQFGDNTFTNIHEMVKKSVFTIEVLKEYAENDVDWCYLAQDECEDEIEDARRDIPSILEEVQSKVEDAITHTHNDAFEDLRHQLKQIICDVDDIVNQVEDFYENYCESIQATTIKDDFYCSLRAIEEIFFALSLVANPLATAEFQNRTSIKIVEQNTTDRIAELQKQNAELQSQLDEINKSNADLQELIKGFSELLGTMKTLRYDENS